MKRNFFITIKKKWILIFLAGVLSVVMIAGYFSVTKASTPKPTYSIVIDAGHGGRDGGCVGESGITESPLNLKYARKLAQLCEELSVPGDITYHAIWSNQCIELWFLLHFSYMHSDLHRSEYWPKLTEHLRSLDEGDYTKNRPDMYRILYPMMDYAIANAKHLAADNHGKPPSRSAPGTAVYQLIELLKPYLTEE